jgi:hypothetical protein
MHRFGLDPQSVDLRGRMGASMETSWLAATAGQEKWATRTNYFEPQLDNTRRDGGFCCDEPIDEDDEMGRKRWRWKKRR